MNFPTSHLSEKSKKQQGLVNNYIKIDLSKDDTLSNSSIPEKKLSNIDILS